MEAAGGLNETGIGDIHFDMFVKRRIKMAL
jgi:hypothetical protein